MVNLPTGRKADKRVILEEFIESTHNVTAVACTPGSAFGVLSFLAQVGLRFVDTRLGRCEYIAAARCTRDIEMTCEKEHLADVPAEISAVGQCTLAALREAAERSLIKRIVGIP